MRTFYYFIILALMFTACKKAVNNEIVVTGHLNDTLVKEVSLISDNLVFKASVDSNGTFVLKFDNLRPRVYQLRFNEYLNLFLIPGDSIVIEKDEENYNFSGGQSAVLSNYYLEWGKYLKKLGESFDEKEYYSREPDDFTKTVYSYIDTFKVPLNDLKKNLNDINQEFLRLENERLKYWMIIDFLPYEYERHQKYTGKAPVLNSSFYAYMNDVDFNDSSLLQLESYKDFLTSYILNKTSGISQSQTEIPKNKYTETNIAMDLIMKEIKNQQVLDYVIYEVIDNEVNLLHVNDEILNLFNEHCYNEDYKNRIGKKYKDLQVLMPGNSAPDFTLYDANDKTYKLSDFSGKYLLIDVWGAFCNPCKNEMPYLKQIEHDYKGKNINFICVCFENKKEVWLQRMKEWDLDGIQLIAKNGWNSQFRNDYQVPWVPTYILIDTQGKIVDARASRPSENLRDLLDKTL